MIETYRLDQTELPILPCPHDCVIKKIAFDDSYITFVFEEHISLHESIQHIRPQSDSLIVRYHLIAPDFLTYRAIRHATRLGKRFGNEGYHLVDNRELKESVKFRLEYLGQRIDFKTILVELCREDCVSILVDAAVDSIEYEWIDRVE